MVDSNKCQVCHQICRPLRCTRCRIAFYCSAACQRVDWKAGHRKACRSLNANNINHALREIQTHVLGLSMEEAVENYHKAKDEIHHYISNEGHAREFSELTASSKRPSKSKPAEAIVKDPALEIHTGEPKKSNRVIPTTSPRIRGIELSNDCNFVVEDMQHISRYQFYLSKPPIIRLPLSLDDVEVSTIFPEQFRSILQLTSKTTSAVLFCVEVPQRLESRPISFHVDEEHGEIQISFQYKSDPTGMRETEFSGEMMPAEAINHVHCRYCDQRLVPKKSISQMRQLPSGYWDEIADYLICYDGVSSKKSWIFLLKWACPLPFQ